MQQLSSYMRSFSVCDHPHRYHGLTQQTVAIIYYIAYSIIVGMVLHHAVAISPNIPLKGCLAIGTTMALQAPGWCVS